MAPASRALSLAAAAAALLAACALLVPRGILEGGFRIDEAHKISETVFLRLLASGRVSDRLWFAHVVDRTNPPAGKYLLGAGIALQGYPLPSAPSLSHASADGSIPALHTDAQSAPYRALLIPARRAALAATALAAALVAFSAARAFGTGAAAAAALLFILSFPVWGWGATAVFDPFLAAAFAATLPIATALERRDGVRAAAALGAAAGIAGAVAFQIRLSGLVALGAFLLAAAFSFRRELAKLAACAASSLAAFAVVAVAINPFYWAAAAGDGIPAALRDGPLPGRIVGRIGLQVRELASLFALVAARNDTLRGPVEKLRFTAEIAFGDPAGIALLFGLLAFAGFAPWRARAASDAGRALLIAAASLAAVYVAWLPLPWPRYVLPIMPLLATLGGIGWSWLFEAAAGVAASRSVARSAR